MNLGNKCDWEWREEVGEYNQDILYSWVRFSKKKNKLLTPFYLLPTPITTSFKQTFKLPSLWSSACYWPSSFLGHPLTTLLSLLFQERWRTRVYLCGKERVSTQNNFDIFTSVSWLLGAFLSDQKHWFILSGFSHHTKGPLCCHRSPDIWICL